MAILWKKQVNGTRYEVRTAGNSRRLYSDGVFHSQYNPTAPVTGSVWDLLTLPAFFYPHGKIKRALVLGVGGGAVIQQLRHFVQPGEIIGIERDPVHLYVARRFFGVTQENVDLHEADAVQWINEYEGPPFDMVIDDLFGERDGEPIRAVSVDAPWFDCLSRHLTRQGMLVINFASSKELRQSAYFSDHRVERRFKMAFQLTVPLCDNAVGVFLRRESGSHTMKDGLKKIPMLETALRTKKLRYNIRRIGKQETVE